MKIDVREEIATAPLGRYHALIGTLIGFAVFFDGYDTFNAAYVIHYVMQPWHLAPSQAGFLVSSGLIGFMIGSLVQGKFSDRVGRRATMIGALWIATVFSFATATLANSFVTFCALRLLTGLGLGALLPVGVTYMNEYSPRRFRNMFALWGWALGFGAGGVVASLIGVYVTPTYGWQALYYVATLSVVLAAICQLALPESLQYLAMHGRTAEIGGRIQGAGRAIHIAGAQRQARIGRVAARSAISGPHARGVVGGLLCALRYFRINRLGAHRDDPAGRDLRRQFRIRRADSGDGLCRIAAVRIDRRSHAEAALCDGRVVGGRSGIARDARPGE
jgi:AAHS family 4-hydroxybenzoate transporter-like MFS transporter